MYTSGAMSRLRIFLSVTRERATQHATVSAADHLQLTESHRLVSGPCQAVQPRDHEDYRQICTGRYRTFTLFLLAFHHMLIVQYFKTYMY